MKKPTINLYLATSTSCNVRCKSCPIGRMEYEPGGTMKMDMFNRILDKCTAEANVIGVQLYHYNEPTLIPWMDQMVLECRKRKLPTFMSSNLVVWKHLPAILKAAPDVLLISVSGWTQEIYERSHKNGDIKKVRENMRNVSLLKEKNTFVQVSWHQYPYNMHEESMMRSYSERLGFKFVPYATSLIPHDRAMRAWETGVVPHGGEDLLIPVMKAKDLCMERRHWRCLLQDQIVPINGEGMLLNCSNLADIGNLRGSLFDTTIPEFLEKRKTDSFCNSCKSVGGHIYALQQYTRPRYSVLTQAEQLYRWLGLAGKFRWITAWATRNLYKQLRPS